MVRVRHVVVDRLRLFLPKALLSFLLAFDFFTARAAELEAAGAYYADASLRSIILSMTGGGETRQLWSGPGRATAARLGYTTKLMSFKDPDDLMKKRLGDDSNIVEQALSIALDQGLQVGTQVGVLAGLTKSPLTDSRYFAVKGGHWWLEETLQTNFEVRHTTVKQPQLIYTDTDGARVATPEDLDGLSTSLTLTHLTTPSTIVRATASRSTRSDRPVAYSTGVEVRQYLAAVQAAVHAALTHYENVGELKPVTQTGSVIANSVRLEWHQRLPRRVILMGGYRYHLEIENPRAADAANKQLGSDAVYATARWRLGKGVWTDDGHELYMFLGRYSTNAPTQAYMVGMGGRYLF